MASDPFTGWVKVWNITTLLLSTETEGREKRLIPVQPSLKTAHITGVRSKHMGDKLDSNSHLSISHFTCYINHPWMQEREGWADTYGLSSNKSKCGVQNKCAETWILWEGFSVQRVSWIGLWLKFNHFQTHIYWFQVSRFPLFFILFSLCFPVSWYCSCSS